MSPRLIALSVALLVGGLTSCGKKETGKTAIKMAGSTTLAPMATVWAEAYAKIAPGVSISVSAGGSGGGITELTEGRIDICNSSRPMKDEEKKKIKDKHGKDAVEIAVAYDALAVFVAKSNPINEISIEQLKEIYSEGSTIKTWDQVAPGGLTTELTVLGRESNSGTGEYFSEAVLGKGGKSRAKISEMNSSQAVIDTLKTTVNGIAYDGIAFKTDDVKALSLSKKKGEPAVVPSPDDARSGKYPLARKLFFYTIGEPTGEAKKFIDWVTSAEGQAIVTSSKLAVSLK